MILLSFAAAEGYIVYQTDVVQVFLYGKLGDVNIYTNPPAGFQCTAGFVIKLQHAKYGLHQAPMKFKQEVMVWFKES